MKKITGYIGAMIIVFALMGSVLLGYALNINGNTAITNDYEPVTDVSGLYAHSEEKSYIDYNPASNYIGYEMIKPYDSSIGNQYHKEIKTNLTITGDQTAGTITYDGKTLYPTGAPAVVFWCDWGYIHYSGGQFAYRGFPGALNNIGDFTVEIKSNNNVKITFADQTIYSFNCLKELVYSDNTDYDYYMVYGTVWGGTTGTYTGYYDDTNEIMSVSSYSGTLISNVGKTYRDWYINGNSETLTTWQYSVTNINGALYSLDPVYDPWNVNIFGGVKTLSGVMTFYPKTAYSSELGINYTQSARVNNYPAEYDYNTTTTVQTTDINLMSVSAANQWTRSQWTIGYRQNQYFYYDSYHFVNIQGGQFNIKSGIKEYKISDLLSTVTIPSGTTSIRLDCASLTNTIPTANVSVNPAIIPGGNVTVSSAMPYDTALTAIYPIANWDYGGYQAPYKATYAIYYPDTGQLEIFDINDVKIATASSSYAVVRFVENTTNTGVFNYDYQQINGDNMTSGTSQTSFNLVSPRTPNLRLTFSVNGVITDTHYMDITKGVSIKSTNFNDTVWNNNYENGNIQLLFRAENTSMAYSNQLTVCNNDISIDYDGGHYYVTLNTNEPVDIGTWRSIILNVDLVNGKLSAIPVRTFNSFTNVQMDSTSIFIGDLINASPTNTITWGTTANSLMFNVYQTAVFMDTYGVVMVNPTLDITTYFTDLNNFYRMKIYNFSIYGESITINGITGTVTGNTLTINDETLAIKEMYVTYADNHAYIEDSHVSVDLGEITTTTISMTGSWYFNTVLQKGYTASKMVYDWDWSNFILDNTQFCIFYIGLALAALVIARRFCNLSMIDYAVFIASIIIALSIQVIA